MFMMLVAFVAGAFVGWRWGDDCYNYVVVKYNQAIAWVKGWWK